jgi:hypothetical protein
MNALVVVESMWGNTRIVAEAVARGPGGEAEYSMYSKSPSDLPDDVGLLDVGVRHASSMSRTTTRHDADAPGTEAGARKHRPRPSDRSRGGNRDAAPTRYSHRR